MDTFNHGSQQQQHQQAQQQHQQKSGHAAATPSYAAHPEASVGGQQTPNEKRHGHQYGGMNPATAHYDPYSVPIMSPAYQQNGSNNTPVRYPGHAATFYPGAPLAQFPIPAGAQIYHTAAGQVLVYPEGLQGMPFYTHMNTTPPQTPANTASFFQPGQEFHYYTPPGHGPLMAPGLTPSSGLGSAERRRSSGISDGSSPRTPEFQYHEAQQTPVRQNHPHKLRFNSPSLVGLERLGAAGKFRKPSGTPYQHSIHSIQEHLAFEGFMNHHEDGVNTNVYIRGLSAEMDDDKLFEMTACYGNVISHKAIMDTENGGCKGYGFARFETVEEAVLCIEKLTEMNIEADFARESFNSRLKRLADPSSTNVYVSNLPFEMNEKGMEEIFHGYKVISNRILRDANGKSRGVGFARFTDRETCDEIINKFHGMPIGNAGNILQIRYADTAAQKKFKATTARRKVADFVGSRFPPGQGHEHISDGSSTTCVDESRKIHKTMQEKSSIDTSLEECGLQISSLEIGEDLLN